MNFTITPGSFLRLLEMTGGGMSQRRWNRVRLRLVACEGRLCLENDGKAFEAEALVWGDGQCRVSQGKLLRALKRYAGGGELKIWADEHRLHLDGTSIPVSDFSPQATLPTDCQVFLASDLDVVSPETIEAIGA